LLPLLLLLLQLFLLLHLHFLLQLLLFLLAPPLRLPLLPGHVVNTLLLQIIPWSCSSRGAAAIILFQARTRIRLFVSTPRHITGFAENDAAFLALPSASMYQAELC
jgi:hypothetical protein